MADRKRKNTIAPSPPKLPSLRISTRTGEVFQYALPPSVTNAERQLITEALEAVSKTTSSTEMDRLDLYLSELDSRGLSAYRKEIEAARRTLHQVIRAGGEWKTLMKQSGDHWVLTPMLMKLS